MLNNSGGRLENALAILFSLKAQNRWLWNETSSDVNRNEGDTEAVCGETFNRG
jgi:hypothetical protein